MSKARFGVGVVLIFSWTISTGAVAQSKWEIGAKGGFGISDVYGKDAVVYRADGTKAKDWGSKLGVRGGAFARVNVNNNLALQVEVLYAQNGAEASVSDDLFFNQSAWGFFKGDIELNRAYIETPLLIVLPQQITQMISTNAFVGPVLGFKLESKLEYKGTLDGIPVDNQLDKDTLKAIDFGGTLGVGIAFEAGAARIIFDGRWTIGLISTDDSDLDLDQKNSAFAFMGGIAFPLGRRQASSVSLL